MNDSHSELNVHFDGTSGRLALVLFVGVILMSMLAGILGLDRAANNAEEAGYAKGLAQSAKDDANRAEKEARLAEYYAVDLKIYMAEQGLHPPDDPWGKPKGAHK